MTIAANFKKYAQALALQLPLPFGRLRMLRQARPTTRAGRAARAARKAIRAAAIKVKVMYTAKRPAPAKKPAEAQTMFQLALALARLENMDLAGF
jgi:hypothetical protein